MKKLLWILLIVFLIWFLGGLTFSILIPKTPKNEELKTDAIIVLTGGKGRIKEGVKLLKEGKADKLFISGVDKKVTIDEIKMLALSEDVTSEDFLNLKNKINLGYYANNTTGNAWESRKWLDSNNFKTVRLVTSNYHSSRAYIKFKTILPKKDIILHPISNSNFFSSLNNMKIFFYEYNKFLFSYPIYLGIVVKANIFDKI